MSKRFVNEITYMKAICMLGVIAIHVGSYALSNPHVNVVLIGFLEIFSRYSIPTFFFLSAFGLFWSTPLEQEFNYKNFLKKRLKVVIIPYFTWSILYMLYHAYISKSLAAFYPQYFIPSLLFGNTNYQLYFLVIIFWFYLLMPLWRYIVKIILNKPILYLSILFILQNIINYYISFEIGKIHFANPILQYLLDMRLNYWVIPYFWVFLLGAVMAEKYDYFTVLLHRFSGYICLFYALSLGALLGSYYYALDKLNYSLLSAIYTFHQLNPIGVIYTASSILFFMLILKLLPPTLESALEKLGQTSYGMYLIHPFILYLFTPFIIKLGLIYNSLTTIGLFIIVVLSSYFFTKQLNALPPQIRKLLLGH